MSGARKEIEDLLEQIDLLPYGPQEIALVRQAVALADDAGETDLAYLARLHLIASGAQIGDTEASLTAFSWCLGKHDEDPQRFSYKVENYDLLWYFKHMASHLTGNPIFSLTQLEQMLDDMESRYRAAGVGLSGLWQARFSAACRTGDLELAAGYRQRREEVPRDDYSHCEACVRAEDIQYFAAIGNDAEALRLYDEIIEQNLSCADEPESCESESLLRLLRAGRLPDALAAHLRSYRMARNNPDGFPMLWNHLVFCALTGNEARGLAILEQNIHQLAGDPLNLNRRFDALIGYGVLLDAVVRAGQAAAPVRAADSAELQAILRPGAQTETAKPAPGFDVSGLAAACWQQAEELATRFDSRNGKQSYREKLDHFRELDGEHYDVEISGFGFVSAELPTETKPGTAADWLERAYVASGLLEQPEVAVDAAERAMQLAEDELTRSRASSSLIYALIELDRDVEALTVLPSRADALRGLGMTDYAALEERLGLLLFGRATASDEELLRAELRVFDAVRQDWPTAPLGAAEAAVSLRSSLAIVLWHAAKLDEAVLVAREAIADAAGLQEAEHREAAIAMFASLFASAGDDSLIPEAAKLLDQAIATELLPTSYLATALRSRAQIHGSLQEFQRGAELADRRADICLKARARRQVIESLSLAAALYSDAGRDDLAVQRTQQALGHAELADLTAEVRTAMTFRLGRYQYWAGQVIAAVETLEQVRQEELAAEVEPGSRAETMLWLGRAASAAENLGLANHAWGQAMELASQAGKPETVAMAGLDRAQLLLNVGSDEAVETASLALQAARETQFPQLIVQGLDVSGRVRVRFGDEAGLSDFDEGLALARQHGAEWEVADLTDSKGRCAAQLGQFDQATALLLTAADLFAAAHDPHRAAMSELGLARAAVDLERPEVAITAYRSCLDRLTVGTPVHAGVSNEFADFLEGEGQREEAALVRAAADFGTT